MPLGPQIKDKITYAKNKKKLMERDALQRVV